MSKELPAQAPLPESIAAFLDQRSVRSFEDVIDYASVCARAVVEKGLNASTSKELRLWGELMYTCVHSQGAGDTGVSVIGQLIQIAGNDAVEALQPLTPTFQASKGGRESTTGGEMIEEDAKLEGDFQDFVDILEEDVCVPAQACKAG